MKELNWRVWMTAFAGLFAMGAAAADDAREPGLLPPISLQAPFAGEPLILSEANPAQPTDAGPGETGRSTLELLPPPPAPTAEETLDRRMPPKSVLARSDRPRPPASSAPPPARRWWTVKSSSARGWARSSRPAPAVR